jgi:hypothetical protein
MSVKQEMAKLKEYRRQEAAKPHVSWETMQSWKEQIVADTLKWASIKVKEPQRLQDYEAGVREGMGQIIRTLKLQGLLSDALTCG